MTRLFGKFASEEHFPFPMMLNNWGVTVIGVNWMAWRVSAKEIKGGKSVCWSHQGSFLE